MLLTCGKCHDRRAAAAGRQAEDDICPIQQRQRLWHTAAVNRIKPNLIIAADIILAALTIGFLAAALIFLWLGQVEAVTRVPATPAWIALASTLFLLNLLANVLARLPPWREARRPPIWLWLAMVSALLLMLLFGSGICAVLWILVIAQLPRYFSWRSCLLAALLVPMLVGLYQGLLFDQDFVLINTVLYALFNLFALYICFTLQAEQQAREYASQLVRELKATQSLLSSASKRDERLRIARELHDLLGHHLAALSIQLEIARHTEAQPRDHAIDRAGTIAHLLLSDMREAVSEFRERRGLDLRQALTSLLEAVPRPRVWLQIQPGLIIDDVHCAEVILRCAQEALTNILRHSQASRAAIVLRQQGASLQLTVEDNGGLRQLPLPGNGMRGMQERAQDIGGRCDWECGLHGLKLTLTLPWDNGLLV